MSSLELLNEREVYEPSDDSFLLAGAVKEFSSGSFLDMGCGSGIQGITAAVLPKVKEVWCVDVSDEALELAEKNALTHHVSNKIVFKKSDLFSNIERKFDCISFNPPYLPTEEEERVKGVVNRAYDGGLDGRDVIDKFLNQFPKHLEENGMLLFLQSSLCGDAETFSLLEKQGFSYEILESKHFFFEDLKAIKAVRN